MAINRAPAPREVKASDLDAKTKELGHEELENLKQKRAALDKLLADNKRAKYKIEVMFRHTRRTIGLISGQMTFWESGTKLNGDGDSRIYFCPSREKKISDCEALLPDVSNGFGHLVCPKCGGRWKDVDVIGEIYFNLPIERWAEALVRYYARAEHNADIYLKYPKLDIRKVAEAEQMKQLGGEKYNKLRTERVLYIYPLANIIQDTSAGSTLYDRFKAFLTA